MKKLFFGLIISFFALTHAIAAAQRHTGMYSNMSFNDESGDVLGIEVFVLYSTAGYYVVFQQAEGTPSQPILVNATIQGDAIKFELPKRNGYYGSFTGEFVGDYLIGSFEEIKGAQSAHELKLIRRNSYWQ